MKERLKRMSAIALAVCLIAVCAFPCFCTDKKDDSTTTQATETADEKNGEDFAYLLSVGYPKEFLDSLTDTTMMGIVRSIGKAEVVDVICKTEDTKDSRAVTVQSVTAVLKDAKTGKITGKSVCVYWRWNKNRPLLRDEDRIIIKWNGNAFCYDYDDVFYAEDYKKENEGDKWTAFNRYTVPARLEQDYIWHWTQIDKSADFLGGAAVIQFQTTNPKDTVADSENIQSVEYEHLTDSRKNHFYAWVVIVLGCFNIVVIPIIRRRKNRRED